MRGGRGRSGYTRRKETGPRKESETREEISGRKDTREGRGKERSEGRKWGLIKGGNNR